MVNSLPARNNRPYAIIAAAIVIAGVVIFAAMFTSSALYVTKTITTTATTTDTFVQTIIVLPTVSSTSCDYVIPGPCPTGQTFPLSVNYTGPWTVAYQGYNAACYTNCYKNTQTLSGSYDGSGFNSRNITVSGQANGWTLCAQAHKLDGSDSTLTLQITGQNETSLPFGSTSTCSEAQIV